MVDNNNQYSVQQPQTQTTTIPRGRAQYNSTQPQKNSTKTDKPKSKFKLKKVLFLLLPIILITIVVSFFVFDYTNKKNILIDKRYGFKLTKLQGWQIFNPENDSYLTLATVDNNQHVSRMDLTVIKAREVSFEDAKKICENSVMKNAKNLENKKIEINGILGYKCAYEVVIGDKSGKTRQMVSYAFLGDSYTYIFWGYFPKDSETEAIRVENLINGFIIF